MVDIETVKQDSVKLQETYETTIKTLDRTWRQIALETKPQRRAALEKTAADLTYTARIVAGAHERAVKALQQIGGAND